MSLIVLLVNFEKIFGAQFLVVDLLVAADAAAAAGRRSVKMEKSIESQL